MAKRLTYLGAVMLVSFIAFQPDAAWAEKAFKPKIHKHTAYSNAFLTNSYIIETKNGLVVIDPPFTVSSSRSLRAQIVSLKKPLLAILLTHHHPDHRNGSTIVAGGKALPFYAEKGVAEWVVKTDKGKAAFWKKYFGKEIPDTRMLPNKVVADGHSMKIDGVAWSVHLTGPSEGHRDSHWIARMPGGAVYAFVGDTAMPDFHGWLADGHTKVWMDVSIPKLKAKFTQLGVRRVFVGHGNSGPIGVLDWQRAYLKEYRKNIRELAADGSLTKAEKGELTRRMIKWAKTENEAGLIGFSADTVAKEMGLIKK